MEDIFLRIIKQKDGVKTDKTISMYFFNLERKKKRFFWVQSLKYKIKRQDKNR